MSVYYTFIGKKHYLLVFKACRFAWGKKPLLTALKACLASFPGERNTIPSPPGLQGLHAWEMNPCSKPSWEKKLLKTLWTSMPCRYVSMHSWEKNHCLYSPPGFQGKGSNNWKPYFLTSCQLSGSHQHAGMLHSTIANLSCLPSRKPRKGDWQCI